MLIKLISDTHNDHHQLNSKDLESDILIHCGDACTKGNYSEGYAFLMWFVKQPAKYKILVPGNHDKKLREHKELIKLAYDLGIIVLNDDYLEINGISFYGHSKTFMSSFKYTKEQISMRKSVWKNIPENLDFLLTHMPPYGILDTNREGEHCGCPELLEKVKEVKPIYHIFGHIHENGHTRTPKHDTTFINVANKNREYILVRPPYTINF